MPTRKEMKEAIKADYGSTLLDEHIDLVLDLYEKRPEYVEMLCKDEKKKHKRAPEPKTRLTIEELELLNKKFAIEEPEIIKSNSVTIQPCTDPIANVSDVEIKNLDTMKDPVEINGLLVKINEKISSLN